MTRVFLVVCAVALTACSGSTDEIKMNDALRFDPSPATVEAGSAATFVNDSSQPHTVTAYEDGVPPGGYFSSGGFDSEAQAREGISEALIPPGESFELTLAEPGTYRYFCIPHESQGMKGTLEVE